MYKQKRTRKMPIKCLIFIQTFTGWDLKQVHFIDKEPAQIEIHALPWKIF